MTKPVSSVGTASSALAKTGSSRWHAFAAAWFGEAFDAMDSSIYFIALYPAMAELLHSKNDSEIGWYGSVVLAVFMLGWAAGAVLFGMLADRIGRAKTMIISIPVYAIASGLCAMSHNWVELAVCRFIVGIGIGGEIGLGYVLIAEAWKGRSRLWATCAGEASFTCGVLFCAFFNEILGHHGWRWLFVAGLLPALFTLYIRSSLKESDAFVIVDTHRKTLANKQARELSVRDHQFLRLPLMELWQGPTRKHLLVMTFICTCTIIGWSACLSWISPWINQITGSLAVDERSLASTILSIGCLVGCFITPIFFKRFGRVLTMKICFGAAFLCTAGMFLTVKSYGLPLLFWNFVVGIFVNMQFAALAIYIPEIFTTRFLASAMGFCFGAGRVFAAVIALCGGQLIILYHGSYALASATLAFIYVIGLIASFWLPETNGEVVVDQITDPAVA